MSDPTTVPDVAPHPRMPRRVVLASRLFPPEPGAAAYRLGALVRSLADRGMQVDVLTTRPPRQIRGKWSHAGTRARRWPVLRDKGGNVRGYVQYASFDVPLAARLLLTRRPDVVVVEPPPTTGVVVRLVCALRRVPYVYYAGDVSTTAAAGMGAPGPVVSVLRRVETWVLRGARHILAVSDGVARDIRQLAGDDMPISMVGTGADTDTFFPRGGTRGPTLVYAGTLSELQGADVFVRAFAEICDEYPDAELVMYGQGARKEELVTLARGLAPGRIHFPGLVGGADVAHAFSHASAGLASLRPDVGYEFSFPTKMFAVTACGTPVLYAGPGPGRLLVIEHDLGWAVDWDAAAVADAMRQALDHSIGERTSQRLVDWTQENASQRAVSRRAADAIAAVANT